MILMLPLHEPNRAPRSTGSRRRRPGGVVEAHGGGPIRRFEARHRRHCRRLTLLPAVLGRAHRLDVVEISPSSIPKSANPGLAAGLDRTTSARSRHRRRRQARLLSSRRAAGRSWCAGMSFRSSSGPTPWGARAQVVRGTLRHSVLWASRSPAKRTDTCWSEKRATDSAALREPSPQSRCRSRHVSSSTAHGARSTSRHHAFPIKNRESMTRPSSTRPRRARWRRGPVHQVPADSRNQAAPRRASARRGGALLRIGGKCDADRGSGTLREHPRSSAARQQHTSRRYDDPGAGYGGLTYVDDSVSDRRDDAERYIRRQPHREKIRAPAISDPVKPIESGRSARRRCEEGAGLRR